MRKISIYVCVFSFLLIIFLFFYRNEKKDFIKILLSDKATYFVEIADTPEKAEMGLMYRKSMSQNQGMLFKFPYPKNVHMWMKNTYIPLDMIFFNAGGEVICLRENAVPLDEKNIISCPYPTSMVLELNAGEIQTRKIQLGDFLSYP